MHAMPPEEVRYEVRAHLYTRPQASEQVPQIRRHLARRGIDLSDDAVSAALVFLEGLEPAQVSRRHNPMGGSLPFWQITSAGVLAHERNE